MQNVMQIATNAGHTAQNDAGPRKMTAALRKMMAATLNVCQGPKGGL